jgi:cytidylate kinase
MREPFASTPSATRSSERLILAVDGHDGSGKTTAARRLAQRIGAPYVRPYAGAAGAAFLATAEAGDFELACEIAARAVRVALESRPEADVLVFDRHWVTVASVVPPGYLEDWRPLPATAVCWADLATTLERVAGRAEAQEPLAWHRRYVERYRELAERFGCHLVRTDELTEDEVVDDLVAWAEAAGATGREPGLFRLTI